MLLNSPSHRGQRTPLPLAGKGHNPLCVKQGKEVRAICHSLGNPEETLGKTSLAVRMTAVEQPPKEGTDSSSPAGFTNSLDMRA